MSVQQQLKRNNVIDQLTKLGVYSINGQDLASVKYSILLRRLAAVRASEN